MHVSRRGSPRFSLCTVVSCNWEPSHWAVARGMSTCEQLHAAKYRGAGVPLLARACSTELTDKPFFGNADAWNFGTSWNVQY